MNLMNTGVFICWVGGAKNRSTLAAKKVAASEAIAELFFGAHMCEVSIHCHFSQTPYFKCGSL